MLILIKFKYETWIALKFRVTYRFFKDKDQFLANTCRYYMHFQDDILISLYYTEIKTA